jgi:hypothetical protein
MPALLKKHHPALKQLVSAEPGAAQTLPSIYGGTEP